MNLAKLKGRRVQLGFTQKEFAKKIGISEATYNLKEQGKRKISVDEICTFAKLLNVKETYFFED